MIDLPPPEICIPVVIDGVLQQVCAPSEDEQEDDMMTDKKVNPVPNSGGVPIKPPPTPPTPTTDSPTT